MSSIEREMVRLGWENLNNGWWKKGNRLMSLDEAVALELRSAQQGVQSDVCPSCGVDDWAYGDDTNTFEVCAMCGKRR